MAGATTQKTLAIIKPNVFRQGKVEAVLARIAAEGFVVAESRVEQLDERRCGEFYAEHRGKDFFERLVRYMTSGPVRLLVLAREDAIAHWREVVGPTLGAKEAAPTSLRGQYGTDLENGFHGSDSQASARREILFFFPNQRVESGLTPEAAQEYLDRAVMPLLTRGLTTLSKEKPTDPVLFLANWLLENNPNKPKIVQPLVPTSQQQQQQQQQPRFKTKKDVVFVLGGPGSGKGTQCLRLADEFKLAHLSTGDLLRAEVAKGSAEGREIAQILKDGRLVPQDTVVRLLGQAIVAAERATVLVDGFPRSIEQLALFEAGVKQCRFAIYFDCSEEAMMKRILKRAEATPVAQRRSDDNEDVARKRFRTFRDETMPVLGRLRQEGRLITVNAEADIDSVYQQVRQLFLP